jgi:hypothetical protein
MKRYIAGTGNKESGKVWNNRGKNQNQHSVFFILLRCIGNHEGKK